MPREDHSWSITTESIERVRGLIDCLVKQISEFRGQSLTRKDIESILGLAPKTLSRRNSIRPSSLRRLFTDQNIMHWHKRGLIHQEEILILRVFGQSLRQVLNGPQPELQSLDIETSILIGRVACDAMRFNTNDSVVQLLQRSWENLKWNDDVRSITLMVGARMLRHLVRSGKVQRAIWEASRLRHLIPENPTESEWLYASAFACRMLFEVDRRDKMKTEGDFMYYYGRSIELLSQYYRTSHPERVVDQYLFTVLEPSLRYFGIPSEIPRDFQLFLHSIIHNTEFKNNLEFLEREEYLSVFPCEWKLRAYFSMHQKMHSRPYERNTIEPESH